MFGFILSGIWLGWALVLSIVSRRLDPKTGGRLLLGTMIGSLLVGVLLLLYSLMRWNFLYLVIEYPIPGRDFQLYWRGLPILGIEFLGVLIVLQGLKTRFLQAGGLRSALSI